MKYFRLTALTMLWMGFAAAAFGETLGNYQWGASAAAVISQTGAEPSSGGTGGLIKREAILGKEAYVTYQFDSRGLSAVGIQWDEDVFSAVGSTLDRQYGASQCASGENSCTWTTQRSIIRLIETPSLGVTLLVFSRRP